MKGNGEPKPLEYEGRYSAVHYPDSGNFAPVAQNDLGSFIDAEWNAVFHKKKQLVFPASDKIVRILSLLRPRRSRSQV